MAAAVPVWMLLGLLARPETDPLWPLHEPGVLLRVVLIYPLLEEWIFRGNVQPWLSKRVPGCRFGISTANLVTSLLFALLHLAAHPPWAAMAVFVPSLVFGWLRDRYGGFVPAFVMHAWYNLGYFWMTSPIT